MDNESGMRIWEKVEMKLKEEKVKKRDGGEGGEGDRQGGMGGKQL